jgi:hypothetical protein
MPTVSCFDSRSGFGFETASPIASRFDLRFGSGCCSVSGCRIVIDFDLRSDSGFETASPIASRFDSRSGSGSES